MANKKNSPNDHPKDKHSPLTRREAAIVRKMIANTLLYGLTEPQTLAYLKGQIGIEISRSTLWRYKRDIYRDKDTQVWLNDFTKVGFVVEHRKRIDEMIDMQHKLYRELLIENGRAEQPTNKGDRKRNVFIILAISDAIVRVNKRLSQLLSGTPILAQMSAAIEHGIEPITSKQQEEEDTTPTLTAAIERAKQWENEERRRAGK